MMTIYIQDSEVLLLKTAMLFDVILQLVFFVFVVIAKLFIRG